MATNPTDRRILALLQADGRASFQSIADDVGLSRQAVMERVRKLEDAGLITGYTTVVNREKLGYPITAFINVRYPNSCQMGTEPGILALRDHPAVLECHTLAGEDCYLLKVAAPSLPELENVIKSLRRPGEPVNTRTTIILTTIFEKSAPLPAVAD